VNSFFVERVQKLHEIVNVHRPSSLFSEPNPVQNFVDQVLHVQVRIDFFVLEGTVDLVVLFQHDENGSL
jgi:hypothetical protein